ncbi:MaoC family dehydratase N-terminal domain-containing protein [Alkalihalobacterium alkalinitrilicum]|uniref:MaoC family dehydratase N-terminal domain-containing protein n=1 Tax=Alkalihalobacterium alkalinitrilicum TaxID=427920 RepID=UPI0009954C19|nr:MaoC family dehydratase N-terminal domain-containing protein [Alkalihalobacterium alkalinitrilicum]
MLNEMIGKRSKKVKNVVERGAVKKFADAIGDLHPIYFDEETGKQSKYQNNIAPPTFPRVFDFGEIEGANLPSVGLIHGEQRYHYERPLLVGEEVFCYSEITDYVEKSGQSGWMGFITFNRYGEDQEGNLIFTEKMVGIITEAVRKGIGK